MIRKKKKAGIILALIAIFAGVFFIIQTRPDRQNQAASKGTSLSSKEASMKNDETAHETLPQCMDPTIHTEPDNRAVAIFINDDATAYETRYLPIEKGDLQTTLRAYLEEIGVDERLETVNVYDSEAEDSVYLNFPSGGQLFSVYMQHDGLQKRYPTFKESRDIGYPSIVDEIVRKALYYTARINSDRKHIRFMFDSIALGTEDQYGEIFTDQWQGSSPLPKE